MSGVIGCKVLSNPLQYINGSIVKSIDLVEFPMHHINISYGFPFGKSSLSYSMDEQLNDLFCRILRIISDKVIFEIVIYKSICNVCLHKVLLRSNIDIKNCSRLYDTLYTKYEEFWI